MIDLGTILYLVLQGLLLLNWPVAVILVRAAVQRPHISALTLMALSSSLVAIGITTYVLAVANAAASYPVPQDVARVLFRVVLVALALFPLLFFWIYRTGRFRDGEA